MSQMYMGYVGFSVAFAFSIAALLGGTLEQGWVRWARPSRGTVASQELIREEAMKAQATRGCHWSAFLAIALVSLVVLWGQPARGTETTTYVLTDVQGTVLAREDAHGTTIATYDYRPYGKQQAGPTTAGPGYTGHVDDPDTGLFYMQARYFDQAAGRFLSPDPIKPSPGALYSFNRFQYANGNPIADFDPSGMCGEVSASTQRLRNLSDTSLGGQVHCFVLPEGQTDFGTSLSSVPGYSESGHGSWRTHNDWSFVVEAGSYNRRYGYKEGDDGYMDANQLKAWAMVESGGDKLAFETDPLQVNNPGDWDPAKSTLLGLAKGESMDPGKSAYAALEWWRTKGFIHDRLGRESAWRGDRKAFERYNGNARVDRTINGLPVEHAVWYANQVLLLRSGM